MMALRSHQCLERQEEVRMRDERNGGRVNGTSCAGEKD
jgi:hypothetical protein